MESGAVDCGRCSMWTEEARRTHYKHFAASMMLNDMDAILYFIAILDNQQITNIVNYIHTYFNSYYIYVLDSLKNSLD